MINDQYLDQLIGQKLLALEAKKASEHKSSGKLSASILGWPLQWQVLAHYGTKTLGFDEYTLRKFARGNQVEEWILSTLNEDGIVIERQKKVEYKGAIGYVDALIKHKFLKDLVIPHEIKSVTNMDFKRILKIREAKPQHALQAGFYALGLGSDYYAVDYVATDDLRLETYIYPTLKIKPEIDKIIEEYDKALATGKIPLFEARYPWQANPKYSNYPDFMELNRKELDAKWEGIPK
jgi:hypothetical protein